jgi:hypothetical protein
MPAVKVKAEPAAVALPITRGDDPSYTIALYTTYDGENAATNVELDITGRTYSSSVSTTRGAATATATPTVTVTSAATGKIAWSMTDTQTDALTASRYVWDLVENAGTSSERTIIVGTLLVSGRATP